LAGCLLILKPLVLYCVWILHTSAAFRIHLTSPPKCPTFTVLICEFIPGLLLPSSLFDRQSFMASFLVPCHFCMVGNPYSSRGELLSLSTVFLGPNSPDEFPFSPCHFYTA
jgi:hypothetical protein